MARPRPRRTHRAATSVGDHRWRWWSRAGPCVGEARPSHVGDESALPAPGRFIPNEETRRLDRACPQAVDRMAHIAVVCHGCAIPPHPEGQQMAETPSTQGDMPT